MPTIIPPDDHGLVVLMNNNIPRDGLGASRDRDIGFVSRLSGQPCEPPVLPSGLGRADRLSWPLSLFARFPEMGSVTVSLDDRRTFHGQADRCGVIPPDKQGGSHPDDVRDAREAARGTPYLSSKEAARYLGFTDRSLQNMRWRGSGPSFVRIGRQIRYHIRDLIDYARKGVPRDGGDA